MSAEPLRIVTAEAALRAARARPRSWCYLGTDTTRRDRLRSALGDDVAVGRALTAIAQRLKQPFLDWIAELGRRAPRPPEWWASALASKSPLQTQLFFLVCCGEALAEWVEGKSPADLIVVEDAWLWHAARDWFGGRPGVSLECERGHGTRRAALALTLVGARRRAVFFVARALTTLRARRWFPRRPLRPSSRRVLIFSWIEARAFGEQGAFNDPYTGRLESILAAAGADVVRLTPVVVPAKFWPAIRSRQDAFVVTPAFVRLADVMRAACARFHVPHDPSAARFLGRDHARLLQREALVENASASFLEHRLWYDTVRSVAQTMTGPSPAAVIYPFENQPHEKLLCLGWRDVAPETRLVGYVTASIPSLLLSFFLGRGEADVQPLPDLVVTNGLASRDLLAGSGYPPSRLVDGGAFRFEHLETVVAAQRTPRPSTAPPRVLVALPTVAPSAKALLDDLMALCRNPLRDPVTGGSVEFVVTFHVDLPREAIADAEDRAVPGLSLTTESVGDFLESAALFLFAPPTGSWREAFIAGLPVLRYRPDMLDLDPVDALAGVELPECSTATLRSALMAALGAPAPPSGEERLRLLRRVYSPIRERLWLELCGLAPTV